MEKLVCDICGGKLIAQSGGVFVCDSCGMEYTKERIKEKVLEVNGTVSVDGKVDVSGSSVDIKNTDEISTDFANKMSSSKQQRKIIASSVINIIACILFWLFCLNYFNALVYILCVIVVVFSVFSIIKAKKVNIFFGIMNLILCNVSVFMIMYNFCYTSNSGWVKLFSVVMMIVIFVNSIKYLINTISTKS